MNVKLKSDHYHARLQEALKDPKKYWKFIKEAAFNKRGNEIKNIVIEVNGQLKLFRLKFQKSLMNYSFIRVII